MLLPTSQGLHGLRDTLNSRCGFLEHLQENSNWCPAIQQTALLEVFIAHWGQLETWVVVEVVTCCWCLDKVGSEVGGLLMQQHQVSPLCNQNPVSHFLHYVRPELTNKLPCLTLCCVSSLGLVTIATNSGLGYWWCNAQHDSVAAVLPVFKCGTTHATTNELSTLCTVVVTAQRQFYFSRKLRLARLTGRQNSTKLCSISEPITPSSFYSNHI